MSELISELKLLSKSELPFHHSFTSPFKTKFVELFLPNFLDQNQKMLALELLILLITLLIDKWETEPG